VSALRVEPLTDARFDAWGALFERAASPCFCRYWHFEGTKNDWLARCAMDPGESRAEMEAALGRRADESLGLIALEGDIVVGWMKLTPRATVPKLRGLPIYRALDLGPDDGVWSVGCILVDPARRRRKIAARLLDAAIDIARARGGRAVEAYPRHAHESSGARLHDDEAMMGPESLYVARGFARVAEAAATRMYPVYRLDLGALTAPLR
jgi:GNAT superfamily N-acetyltransferase